MIWLVAAVTIWLGAWALNVRLSHAGLMRHPVGRLAVPAIFGVTLLVVWELVVRGLQVPTRTGKNDRKAEMIALGTSP